MIERVTPRMRHVEQSDRLQRTTRGAARPPNLKFSVKGSALDYAPRNQSPGCPGGLMRTVRGRVK